MKKNLIILMICMWGFSSIGCGKKNNVETAIEESKNVIPTTAVASTEPTKFSGETIIESQSSTDNGYYLTWYDNSDNLIMGLLPTELVTEYNYPEGTKVKVEAINDGMVKTMTGKVAYKIINIQYLEDVDLTINDDISFTSQIEGVSYVEDQVEKDGETYLVFGFEFDPGYYYYGKISNPIDNMIGYNYYIYASYNEGDLQEGKQYCEITSWENYSYPTYDDVVNSEYDDFLIGYNADYTEDYVDVPLTSEYQLFFDSEILSAVDCEMSYENGTFALSGNIKNISSEWWVSQYSQDSVYITFINANGVDIGMTKVWVGNWELYPNQLGSFNVSEQLSENPSIIQFTYMDKEK